MFSGLKVVFSGGLSAARIKVFSKLIIDNGGLVLTRNKTPSIFKKVVQAPLESDLDYVIIENKQIRLADAYKQLGCSEIPTTVKVIHCSWIEQCLVAKERLDSSPFEITLSDESLDTIVDIVATPAGNQEGCSSSTTRSRSDDDVDANHADSHQQKRMRVGTFETVDSTSMTIDNAERLSGDWHLIRGLIDKKMKPSALFKFSSDVRARTDCAGVLAFDMDGTLITTKSGQYSAQILLSSTGRFSCSQGKCVKSTNVTVVIHMNIKYYVMVVMQVPRSPKMKTTGSCSTQTYRRRYRRSMNKGITSPLSLIRMV
jgi:hypothetical protein